MGALHDAYELGGVAGHGRTTLVRLGVRRGDCSPVALKQLRLEHAHDPDKRGRFVQQARRACMLHHEGIEATLDVVEGSDGPVAVSEWIDGRSLHRLAVSRRRNREPWPALEVALIARDLLEALRHAHHQPTAFDTQGMLHGGLWPGNVLVDVEGNVKLVDFGMASVWQEAREPWQDLEALRYLSADHVRHGPSAGSDLYAVGAIVHELLAGQRFRDECETEADMRTMIDRPTPPERPRADAPVPLERLRRRLLEPVQSPRLTLEHMLDLCAAIPLGGAREGLAALVRDTLRTDSTSPDPEPTPPRGIPVAAMAQAAALTSGPREGVAKARSRDSAAVHFAAEGDDVGLDVGLGVGPALGLGIELRQVPLGQAPRPPRRRDTQSVPIPVDHEQTAARAPRFLQQTAPPSGEEAIAAERERSGSDPVPAPHLLLEDSSESERNGAAEAVRDGEADRYAETEAEADRYGEPSRGGTPSRDAELAPAEILEVDTAPLSVGDPAVPEPIAEDDDAPDLLLEPDVTAEVIRIARLPEDESRRLTRTEEPAQDPSLAAKASLLRGPLGWALLGAAVVGLGIPLLSRCDGAEPAAEPPAATRAR